MIFGRKDLPIHEKYFVPQEFFCIYITRVSFSRKSARRIRANFHAVAHTGLAYFESLSNKRGKLLRGINKEGKISLSRRRAVLFARKSGETTSPSLSVPGRLFLSLSLFFSRRLLSMRKRVPLVSAN